MRQSNRGEKIRSGVTPVARYACALLAAAVVFSMPDPMWADEPTTNELTESQVGPDSKAAFGTELIQGKVVWLADALKREFEISTVPEVAENSLAILTSDGQLVPIVENLRGRAFRKDKRLREMEVEILARRYQRQPLIQILRVYQVDGQRRYEIDYWCDVCAIVMFETGPCSCCQDDNRLRKRLVGKDELPPQEVESAAK